jgi:peptidoglycan/xylan/chitin deacetylase (PgdA/CDA1 family)
MAIELRPSRSKAMLLAFLRLSGALALARRTHRREAVILTYHGVLPEADITDTYLCRSVVAVDAFDRQMRYLAANYTCLPLSEIVQRLAAGRPLPPHAAAVTFDDGFRNNRAYAWPVLQRHRVPATIFLATGLIGGGAMMWTDRIAWLLRTTPAATARLDLGRGPQEVPLDGAATRERSSRGVLAQLKGLDAGARARAVEQIEAAVSPPAWPPPAARYRFLDWDDVRAMRRDGVEFGSHTVTHPVLSTLSDQGARYELEASRATIEAELGEACTDFAYPNGTPADFTDRDKHLLRVLGYRGAATQVPGYNAPGRDTFELHRMHIGLGMTGTLFEAQVTGAWARVKALAPRLAGRDR